MSTRFVLFCVLVFGAAFAVVRVSAAESAVDVCIDPGHGGSDVGAVNTVDGVTLHEVAINLEVSKRLAELLEGAGRSYYFTWHTDETLPADNSHGDLKGRQRAAICNGAGARVVVSVHTNSVADASRDGVWMGYHGGESRQFAEDMLALTWTNLFTDEGAYSNAHWNDENVVNYGTEVFANSLLIHTDVPAIIYEPLFMSDDMSAISEFDALTTTIYGGACNGACRREQIAATLFQGVESELQQQDGGAGNLVPTADFSWACSDLTCSFADESSDTDGTVTGWSWAFGDGATASEQNPVHAFAAPGVYGVSLTVTDDGSASASTSKSVAVGDVVKPLSLSGLAYKVRGVQHADLTWSGASGSSVELTHDGVWIAMIVDADSYTDNLDRRGGGSATYQICESNGGPCSNPITLTW